MSFRDHAHPESGGAVGGSGEVRRPAEHVWVLTGSIGAPTAAARLLGRLSPGLPVAFIVGLRITSDGAPLLANMLARTTPFRIYAAGIERTLYPSDVLVLPVDGSALPDPGTRSGIVPRAIDEVLFSVAERYQDKAGAIALSGIGADGIKGFAAVVRHGGQVWTQEPASCQHSSLPQAIREACKVSYCGSPEQLAARLSSLYS